MLQFRNLFNSIINMKINKKINKKKNFKITVILVTILISVLFFWHFFGRYLYKTKASVDKVKVSMGSTEISIAQNKKFLVGVNLATEETTKKISAATFFLKYDSDDKDLIDIDPSAQTNTLSVDGYFDEVLIQNLGRQDHAKIAQVTYLKKQSDNNLKNSVVIFFPFKAKQKQGETAVSIMESESQVVGPIQDYLFTIESTNTLLSKIIIQNTSFCETNNQCGTNASCQNNTCVCNSGYYNCDGNWQNGCESSNQCDNPTNTPTSTQPSEGSVSLNLKLKFQGVMKEPSNANQRTMKVRIKVAGGNLSSPVSVGADFTLTNNKNSNTDALIWEGTVNLPAQVTPGQKYYLLIKGPKHIQKKICDNTPSETTDGSYRCQGERTITFSSGQNNLDFSKIYLLGGDLPVNGLQNGVVDSLDTSYIRNNLGKTDSDVISVADINLDGIIDAQDWSTVIYALSVKTDEE